MLFSSSCYYSFRNAEQIWHFSRRSFLLSVCTSLVIHFFFGVRSDCVTASKHTTDWRCDTSAVIFYYVLAATSVEPSSPPVEEDGSVDISHVVIEADRVTSRLTNQGCWRQRRRQPTPRAYTAYHTNKMNEFNCSHGHVRPQRKQNKQQQQQLFSLFVEPPVSTQTCRVRTLVLSC